MLHASRRRSRTPLYPLLLVTVLASSCAVSSEQPLSQLEGSEQVPEHLLGTWDVVELVGLNAEDREYQYVIERNLDGSMKAVMTEPAGTTEIHGSLATVGNLTIVSLKPQASEERWMLASLVFDETSQELTVNFLSHAEVIQDIRLGRVAGEVFKFDQDELARLTATPEQLRTYFSAHGTAAFSDPVMVMRRRQSP